MHTLCSLFYGLMDMVSMAGGYKFWLIDYTLALVFWRLRLTQCVKFFMHNYGQHGTLALALEYERHQYGLLLLIK